MLLYTSFLGRGGGAATEPTFDYSTTLTIPSGAVGSNLSNFPVVVSLDHMPEDFWTQVRSDGGDIRVKTGGGTSVPVDLVRIDFETETGILIFKAPSILAASDNDFEIYWGNAAVAQPSHSEPLGRHAVWADYEAVFLFGESADDRAGGARLAINGDPDFFRQIGTSPNIHLSSNVLQGVAWDGTYYYVSHTDRIQKYNASWTLLATNSSIHTEVGEGTDHIGDIDVYDGVIYGGVTDGAGSSWIASWNASDLSFVGKFDVSAQSPNSAAAVCVRPSTETIFLASFDDGDQFWEYQLDGTYLGDLTLSSSLTEIQGLTFWRDAFWASTEDAGGQEIWRVETDGTVTVSGLFGQSLGSGEMEGVGSRDDSLLVALHLGAGGIGPDTVRTWRPEDIRLGAGGGVNFSGDANVEATGRPSLTTYTIGCTISISSKTQDRTAVSYWDESAGTTNTRQSIGYRNATPSLAIWDPNNTYLEPSPTIDPSLNKSYRIHTTYEGTTERQIFVDGVLKNSQGPITAAPGALDTMLIGREDDSNAEAWRGKVGFTYLRDQVLSDDWIAAEYLNLNAPLTFYSVENGPAAGSGAPAGCLAYRDTSTQSVSTDTTTPIQFNAEAYDTDGFHSTVTDNSKFIVPSAYNGRKGRISGSLFSSSSGNQVQLSMRRNGGSFLGLGSTDTESSGGNGVSATSAVIDLATGDEFELTAFISTTSGVPADNRNWGQIAILPTDFKGALLYSSVVQAITSGTSPLTLTWDSVSYDTDGFYDAGAPTKLTVPSGVTKVRLSASASKPSSTGEFMLRVFKSGSQVHGLPTKLSDSAGQDLVSVFGAVVNVSEGDYFEVKANSGNASSFDIPAADNVWFQIEALPAETKGCLLKRSSNQAISAGVTTTVDWNAEEYDTDGFHDNSTNPSRITIPSGVSKVRLTFNFITSAVTVQLVGNLLKNGATFVGNTVCDAAGGTERTNGVSAIVEVTAGDYFEAQIFSTSAINVGSNVENWFSLEVVE